MRAHRTKAPEESIDLTTYDEQQITGDLRPAHSLHADYHVNPGQYNLHDNTSPRQSADTEPDRAQSTENNTAKNKAVGWTTESCTVSESRDTRRRAASGAACSNTSNNNVIRDERNNSRGHTAVANSVDANTTARLNDQQSASGQPAVNTTPSYTNKNAARAAQSASR
jgi:hypothetical protein